MTPLASKMESLSRVHTVRSAMLLAGDDYWDGRGWDRKGRNRFVFRTGDGAYLLHLRTIWPHEIDGYSEYICPEEARLEFIRLKNKRVRFDVAFPLPDES